MIGQSIATFSISSYRRVGAPPPSTDGTSGGRRKPRTRLLSLRDKPLVFTDRPTQVHIEDLDIEAIQTHIEALELRETRMNHLLMAAKDAEQAAKQLKRLESLQARLAMKRLILDDEQALILILSKLC